MDERRDEIKILREQNEAWAAELMRVREINEMLREVVERQMDEIQRLKTLTPGCRRFLGSCENH